MINEDLIDEWIMLSHSENVNIDIKLKEIIEKYIVNTENGLSNLRNPLKILADKYAITKAKYYIKGNEWLLELPYAIREGLIITKDGEMDRLKGQRWVFEELLIKLHAMDDIKKAYIKDYNRMYEKEDDVYDYIVKIFLKSYNAQLKRTYDMSGVFGKVMNTVQQVNVEQLISEIEEREKDRMYKGVGNNS